MRMAERERDRRRKGTLTARVQKGNKRNPVWQTRKRRVMRVRIRVGIVTMREVKKCIRKSFNMLGCAIGNWSWNLVPQDMSSILYPYPSRTG